MSEVYGGSPGTVIGAMPAALTITNVSAANPAVITISGSLPGSMSPASGATSFSYVDITGVVGTAQVVNGVFPATRISGNSFSVPVNTTGLTYTSGGSAQPLCLPAITQPTDDDSTDVSSVNVPFDGTCDSVQFLAQATGAWKLASFSILNFSNLSSGNPQGGSWYSVTSSGAGFVVPGDNVDGTGIPLQVSFNPGDYLDIQITVSWTASAAVALGVGSATINYGASLPTVYSYNQGQFQWINGAASASAQGSAILTQRGIAGPPQGSIQCIKPMIYFPGSGISFQFNSALSISCNLYRPTSMPQ